MRPRRLVPLLVCAALAGELVAPRPARAQASAVGAIYITVSDADRAAAFFTEVLTFEKVSDLELSGDAYARLEKVPGGRARVVELALGQERIALWEWRGGRGRPIPLDSRSNDRWFQHLAIVVADMGRAYERLRAHNVQQVSSAPQKLPAWIKGAAGIEAYYFRDPDGHNLELIHFPRGKGDPRWQRLGERLFLGIDHTAIASGDTAASLRFWRDTLGFRVAGGSENWGVEQEHLSGVFGARVRITALRAPSGPGVELLDYRAPPGGRPAPEDWRASDLASWQTTVRVSDAAALARQAGAVDPVATPDRRLGFSRAVVVRDPDGHAALLVEP
jgi:catechol 2,3-dioxygenase-like lactoylglutathione lyase family enzyme